MKYKMSHERVSNPRLLVCKCDITVQLFARPCHATSSHTIAPTLPLVQCIYTLNNGMP